MSGSARHFLNLVSKCGKGQRSRTVPSGGGGGFDEMQGDLIGKASDGEKKQEDEKETHENNGKEL